MKKVLIAFALVGTLHAQVGPSYFNAPAEVALVSSTGGAPYAPMATSGPSGTSYDNAQPMLMLGYNSTTGKYYVCGTANPCVSGGGGGGATIPSTTNLISGDGAGNGADSGIAPASVAKLTGAAFTGQSSVSSSTSTASAPTFAITDSEPAAVNMIASKTLAPNMANGDTFYWLLGNAESLSNSFFMGYTRAGAGLSANRLSFQAYGVPITLSLFASQHVDIGPSTSDSGYKLDVEGSSRAQQFVGGGTAPTIAAGTGAGTSPTGVTVTGTPTAFTANLTTGTTPSASAVIATITFAAYGAAPHIACQAKNAATAAASATVYATTTTTTAVLNAGTTALTASTAYSWDCLVIQ